LVVFTLLLVFKVLLDFGCKGFVVALVESGSAFHGAVKGTGVAGDESLCSGLISFGGGAGIKGKMHVRVLGARRGVLDVVREGEVYSKFPGALGWARDESIVLTAISYITISICSKKILQNPTIMRGC